MDVGSKLAFYFWVNLKKVNITKWHDLYEHNFKLCWTKRIEMCFRVVVNNEWNIKLLFTLFCVNKCSGYPLSKNTYLHEWAVEEWIHW